jgi:hypothetical protein
MHASARPLLTAQFPKCIGANANENDYARKLAKMEKGRNGTRARRYTVSTFGINGWLREAKHLQYLGVF